MTRYLRTGEYRQPEMGEWHESTEEGWPTVEGSPESCWILEEIPDHEDASFQKAVTDFDAFHKRIKELTARAVNSEARLAEMANDYTLNLLLDDILCRVSPETTRDAAKCVVAERNDAVKERDNIREHFDKAISALRAKI